MLMKFISASVGLAGFVFFLQGSGLFTAMPSLMNNDITWAIIGIVMMVAGLVLWRRK
jgi:LPXTG-motif cell wall-anchored protein